MQKYEYNEVHTVPFKTEIQSIKIRPIFKPPGSPKVVRHTMVSIGIAFLVIVIIALLVSTSIGSEATPLSVEPNVPSTINDQLPAPLLPPDNPIEDIDRLDQQAIRDENESLQDIIEHRKKLFKGKGRLR